MTRREAYSFRAEGAGRKTQYPEALESVQKYLKLEESRGHPPLGRQLCVEGGSGPPRAATRVLRPRRSGLRPSRMAWFVSEVVRPLRVRGLQAVDWKSSGPMDAGRGEGIRSLV